MLAIVRTSSDSNGLRSPLQDQVHAVLVVLRAADRRADVVEQGAVLDQLTLLAP